MLIDPLPLYHCASPVLPPSPLPVCPTEYPTVVAMLPKVCASQLAIGPGALVCDAVVCMRRTAI